MKKILDKMILIVIIYIVLFVVFFEVLRVFSLHFRQWVYILSSLFVVIGFSIGIYYKISKVQIKKRKIILNIVYTIILLIAICNPYTLLFAIFAYQPEHIVEKDNQKMVAYVNGFLDTYVYYYEYKNPLVMGNKIMEEYYGSGGFDPIKNKFGYDYEIVKITYYDKDGNVIKENEDSDETNQNNENINEYDDTYETTQNSSDEFNHVEDVSKILDNPGINSELKKRKEEIEKDELDYGKDYIKFPNFELYSRKPARIVFKQGNKDGFFIFEKDDKAYEHLLVVSEDKMANSSFDDYNLWSFTPDSIDKMVTSGENYIIYDFDNRENEEFQKDIIFRFNSNNRLFRLVSYLAEFKEPVARDNLGKREFAENTEISGYKYMTQYGN